MIPKDFGLKLTHGRIDRSAITKTQADTIVIGMFNFEDYLEDVAVLYKSKNSIVIYRNEGNGSMSEYRKIDAADNKKLLRIEKVKPSDLKENPNQRNGIKLYYADGTEKLIKDREILLGEEKANSKSPERDFFCDAKAFLYGLNWVEQWRSERNGGPSPWVEVGDFDRDGKVEAVYTFWPMSGQPFPTHMVVFECINQYQYRIEWDTTFANGGYNIDFPMMDFDKDGNKEFFAWNRNFIGELNLGLYECTGDGKYKFKMGTFLNQKLPMSIDYSDSVKMSGYTGPGMWIVFSDWGGGWESTEIQKYRFIQKYPNYYSFELYFKNAWPKANWFCYSIAGCDIDKDGKEEVVLGDTQWDTDYITYFDSTGVSSNLGYEHKEIIPNAPISGGYIVSKDLDNDGYKEITVCGIGNHSGSIGTVKHTGSPGQNQFITVWFDSTSVVAMPNMGIDTGSIDNIYSVLFPTVASKPGPIEFLCLYTYSRNGVFTFNQTTNMNKDSLGFIGAKLYDMDNDGKQNIITPFGWYLSSGNYYLGLMSMEQVGTIGIHNISSEVPKDYKLYQNYPNPFNSSTNIKYQITNNKFIKLKIFDILGKEVGILVNKFQKAGTYEVNFNANNLSSGVYFYSLFADDKRIDTKKMLMIK
ncbi:MAG: T9SS type A sorting domain-containing protein [Ignavibacteriae bacterium]|nr:T9SS type A sorting domain-containing protein [Ignavibacteriota bacterium]